MTATLQPVTSFEEVLRLLGGPTRVGRLTNRTPSAVCQWRAPHGDNRFPSDLYAVITHELSLRGLVPALTLFRFDEVANEQARR